MGGITPDQAEWAVVDRMRQMMEEPKGDYLATQTYAMFTAILCWVMQHLRISDGDHLSAKDQAAVKLLGELASERASDAPWHVPVEAKERDAKVGTHQFQVPPTIGFQQHSAKRMLINLRDAMAHGDARKVQPFNANMYLVGFTFHCSEKWKAEGADAPWSGEISLLRDDMRRIGGALAVRYRDAIMAAAEGSGGPPIPGHAADMREDQSYELVDVDKGAGGI